MSLAFKDAKLRGKDTTNKVNLQSDYGVWQQRFELGVKNVKSFSKKQKNYLTTIRKDRN